MVTLPVISAAISPFFGFFGFFGFLSNFSISIHSVAFAWSYI
jgi:hypothetical protein